MEKKKCEIELKLEIYCSNTHDWRAFRTWYPSEISHDGYLSVLVIHQLNPNAGPVFAETPWHCAQKTHLAAARSNNSGQWRKTALEISFLHKNLPRFLDWFRDNLLKVAMSERKASYWPRSSSVRNPCFPKIMCDGWNLFINPLKTKFCFSSFFVTSPKI